MTFPGNEWRGERPASSRRGHTGGEHAENRYKEKMGRMESCFSLQAQDHEDQPAEDGGHGELGKAVQESGGEQAAGFAFIGDEGGGPSLPFSSPAFGNGRFL
jgi:hypothetical protein